MDIMTDKHTGAQVGVRVPDPRRETDVSVLRMMLVSDQALVGEAVGAALASRRLVVRQATWAPADGGSQAVEHKLAELHPGVALLICEIGDSVRLAEVAALVRGWAGPWVVLTGSDLASDHGALLEAGACLVCPNATGLDEVETLLERVARGEQVLPEEERFGLIRQWQSFKDDEAGLPTRLEQLSARQREVLRLMRRGRSARAMAHHLGVSESTVRSHVRAVLWKLDLRSQLTAVAAVQALDDLRAAGPRRES